MVGRRMMLKREAGPEEEVQKREGDSQAPLG